MSHWLVRENLIYEQGRTLGQAACDATGADKIAGSDFEPPQADPKGGGQDARSNPRRSPKAPTVGATERNQALLVTCFTAHTQETVFKPATLQVVLEFPLHVVRQYPAFLGQLLPESRVVLRDQLIE